MVNGLANLLGSKKAVVLVGGILMMEYMRRTGCTTEQLQQVFDLVQPYLYVQGAVDVAKVIGTAYCKGRGE